MWSADLPDRKWLAKVLRSSDENVPLPPGSVPPPVSNPAPADNSQTAAGPKKLRLTSTSPGRNAREGTAQIGTGPSDVLTYAAGALLANGAALTEIYTDRVVLEKDGAFTHLYVEGMATNPGRQSNAPAREDLLLVDAAAPKTPLPSISPLPTYTELVRAAPKFEEGQIVGFEVHRGTDSGAFARLNLQAGDILIAVDGVPMNSTDNLHQALKSISEGASALATVRRGSEHLTLSLDGLASESNQSFVGSPTISP